MAERVSSLPRNPATKEVLDLLQALDFRTELDGDMWIAKRTSGMFTRTFVFPDDPAVPADWIYGSLWEQGREIREEITDLLQANGDNN